MDTGENITEKQLVELGEILKSFLLQKQVYDDLSQKQKKEYKQCGDDQSMIKHIEDIFKKKPFPVICHIESSYC